MTDTAQPPLRPRYRLPVPAGQVFRETGRLRATAPRQPDAACRRGRSASLCQIHRLQIDSEFARLARTPLPCLARHRGGGWFILAKVAEGKRGGPVRLDSLAAFFRLFPGSRSCRHYAGGHHVRNQSAPIAPRQGLITGRTRPGGRDEPQLSQPDEALNVEPVEFLKPPAS